jgi:hypothetical protein
MHVITPSDLKKFQIENYSEMLLNPTSEYHKKFLKTQLKLLKDENTTNRSFDPADGSRNDINPSDQKSKEGGQRIKKENRLL